jgi:antitoxin MazE
MDIRPKISHRAIALRVSRWGNSLAVRLPADYTRRAGVRDGDILSFTEGANGSLALERERVFDRAAFVEHLRRETVTAKTGSSIVTALRRKARY